MPAPKKFSRREHIMQLEKPVADPKSQVNQTEYLAHCENIARIIAACCSYQLPFSPAKVSEAVHFYCQVVDAETV